MLWVTCLQSTICQPMRTLFDLHFQAPLRKHDGELVCGSSVSDNRNACRAIRFRRVMASHCELLHESDLIPSDSSSFILSKTTLDPPLTSKCGVETLRPSNMHQKEHRTISEWLLRYPKQGKPNDRDSKVWNVLGPSRLRFLGTLTAELPTSFVGARSERKHGDFCTMEYVEGQDICVDVCCACTL
jgi:hypothetical protein